MSITTVEDLTNRYTGDEYSLPPTAKLEVLIEDAEDILYHLLPDIEDRIEEEERLDRRIKRVVSGAVIRYINTAAEGIGSHQMSIGGMSEMVSYAQGKNKNSIFFTEEELDTLRDKKKKARLSLLDLYGDAPERNTIIGYDGKVGIYTTDWTDTNKNNFHA